MLVECPVTVLTIVGCVVWWFYSWNYRVDLGDVATSYLKLVEEKQLWRAITAVYTHANLLHLVFNMMSLWNLNFVETTGGSVTYFKYTYFLVVLDELLITSFNWVMVHQFEQDRYRTQAAVGYSGVVFGLMSIVSAAGPLQLISFMGLFSVYSILYPFCSLFFDTASGPSSQLYWSLGRDIGGISHRVWDAQLGQRFSFLVLVFLDCCGLGFQCEAIFKDSSSLHSSLPIRQQ
eukprot:TRINITY_DN4961_c0_g1_i12.p1 TRINITY_DN4961_c0_g1~~TRINITY_DN4961_c0_g1_i12.p1  ORF type:complete len:233 (+),score=42.22 TRINITY_DN4961_c0_g1_i12:631-1329(+)